MPIPPWYYCFNNTRAAEASARDTLVSPLNGATVPAGTTVRFSGESNYPLTFSVASSPALLSSPDIDSGLGSLGTGTSLYTFPSIKAAATPRTIYWEASSTFTPGDCEGPSTFTTPVYTLTVLPPPPTEAEVAARKQREQEEEEVSAKKKREEEEATAAGSGSVSLDGVPIDVQSTHNAAVKLTCAGTATCSGKVTLHARGTAGKSRKRHTQTETIGTATFSITAGDTATINLTLNETGRALLSAAHGHLSATLTIIKTSPEPSTTQIQDVHLEQQKATHAVRGLIEKTPMIP